MSVFFFFSSRRRHTSSLRDWSSDVCSSDLDGRRRWQVYEDRVAEGPAASLPGEVGPLTDASWLLGAALSGGEEITVGGRRAYRVAGRSQHAMPWPLLS